MDLIPDDISPRELREEVNSRTHRAGYTTREGQPIKSRTSAGKGDGVRPYNVDRFRENYQRIFGHS